MKRFVVAIVAAVVAIPAAAAEGDGLLTFVKTKYDDMQGLVKKIPEKEKLHQGIRDIMETFVDYGELSKRTLGDTWGKLKKKEQDEFVAEFKKMIQRTYVKRFDPDTDVRIEYAGEPTKEADGTFTVISTIRSGKSEARVDYKFLKKGAGWWAFDVVIDDVSMVKNYRKQFNDIMAKSGFAGLMDKIRKKNAKAES